jgi:hypothetical protein
VPTPCTKLLATCCTARAAWLHCVAPVRQLASICLKGRALALLPPALSFLPCSLLFVRGRIRHVRPVELASTTARFFVLAANHRTAKYGRASTAARPWPSFAASRQAPELRRRRAVAAASACAHGRSTSGHVPAIRDHQRVRVGPHVLSRPFSATGEPPPAGIGDSTSASSVLPW